MMGVSAASRSPFLSPATSRGRGWTTLCQWTPDVLPSLLGARCSGGLWRDLEWMTGGCPTDHTRERSSVARERISVSTEIFCGPEPVSETRPPQWPQRRRRKETRHRYGGTDRTSDEGPSGGEPVQGVLRTESNRKPRWDESGESRTCVVFQNVLADRRTSSGAGGEAHLDTSCQYFFWLLLTSAPQS